MVNGIRTGRALSATALGLASIAGMLTLVGNEALAVNFTTADQQFQVYSNYVQGVSAGGYLARNNGYSSNSQVAVAELGIKQAKLAGFCAIATESLPVIGTASLIITAGTAVAGSFDPNKVPTTDGAGNAITYDSSGGLSGPSLASAVTVTDLFLNTNAVKGFGNKISGLTMGQDAATVAGTAQLTDGTGTWPTGQNMPTTGNFGLTASALNVAGLNGSSYGINLHGAVLLPHVHIAALSGARTQADCPTQAH